MNSSITEAFRQRQIPAQSPELAERDAQLGALNRLIGRMAHDFNNFLSPILGYLSLIREEVPDRENAVRYVESLEKSARKSEDLMDRYLMMAMPHRQFQPKTVRFDELIGREIDDWTKELPEETRISVSRSLEEAELELDPVQWQSAIRQLLNNARFALAMGGRVEVQLRKQTLDQKRARDLGVAEESVWALVVRDSGIGINPDALPHVFEPFYSTRPKNQALGLGLSTVHSIARWHGGQVEIESREDEGTAVMVYLPAGRIDLSRTPSPQASTSRRSSRAKPGQTHSGKRRILVVDDDPMVLEILNSALTRAQYEVHVAADGKQGVRAFKRKQGDWSLIISDVTMPEMNGVDMVESIRELDPETPILFVSGNVHASSDDIFSKLAPDIPPLIKKPFALKKMLETVENMIA